MLDPESKKPAIPLTQRGAQPGAQQGAQPGQLQVDVQLDGECVDQVLLRDPWQAFAYSIVQVKGTTLELEGKAFLPKGASLAIEVTLPEGGTEAAIRGVVRMVQLEGPEPTYRILVQCESANAAALGRIAHSGVPPRTNPTGLAELMGPGNGMPGWASKMLAHGVVDEADWGLAEMHARREGNGIAAALAGLPNVDQGDIAVFQAMDLGVPYLPLSAYRIRAANAAVLPEELARRHCVFPLFVAGGVLTLGMTDPSDLALIDQVRLRANIQVEPCLCVDSELETLIEKAYGGHASGLVGIVEGTTAPADTVEAGDAQASQATVQRVDQILTESIRAGAGDIHIEPERDQLRVRIRVDGILHQISESPLSQHAAIVSRIKVLSKLDIAETRRPQDGHFRTSVDDRMVDVRVSTLPTVYGENVVLRLLQTEGEAMGLEDLGMPQESLECMLRVLDEPHGMVLVAGPTGSGKTSTLYAALARLATIERNVVTVEDPVEIRLPLLRQTQVHTKAGVTFASGLRSILRQDPDVIMVGEIRDKETAEIAVQASMTGHLVLSTIHTNTALGAIFRLEDLGLAPYLLTTALRAVVSQRLVRRICSACKRQTKPDPHLTHGLGLDHLEPLLCWSGAGCPQCLGTGFRGRIGIYETLELTPQLSAALLGDGAREELEREAREAIAGSMLADGLRKVRAGITTLEEVARLVGLRSHQSA